jgi:hypothetical protein
VQKFKTERFCKFEEGNGMTIRITKKTTKKKVADKLEKKTSKRKTINLNKYFGKVNFEVDGLTYQKEIRKND